MTSDFDGPLMRLCPLDAVGESAANLTRCTVGAGVSLLYYTYDDE